MAEKLTYSVNFLKFFGLIINKFSEPQNKRLKCLKYWPFGMIIIYSIFVTLLTLKMLILLLFDGQFSLHNDYTGIIMMIALHLRACIDLIYTILLRKTERKFWNLLDQLDDYIERFLNINMNQTSENLYHLIIMLLNIFSNICLGVTVSIINYSSNDRFNNHPTSLLAIMNHINMAKYAFYVSILYNRLQYINQNFYKIKQDDYKLYVMSHVHSVIWKLSKHISRRFTTPLMFSIFHVLIMTMFFGFVMAQKIVTQTFTGFHVASIIMPQVTVWIICFNCQRICRNVSEILIYY